MLMKSDPTARLIIGSGKVLLCIIIVERVLECAVCELDDVKDGLKVNLIVITPPMCILIKAVIGTNPI